MSEFSELSALVLERARRSLQNAEALIEETNLMIVESNRLVVQSRILTEHAPQNSQTGLGSAREEIENERRAGIERPLSLHRP